MRGSNTNIHAAIDAGVRFLSQGQLETGEWNDFPIPKVGVSNEWVTAYIGLSVLAYNPGHEALRKAQLYLRERVLCGFHRGIAPDADSTAHKLLFEIRSQHNAPNFYDLWRPEQSVLFTTARGLASFLDDTGRGYRTYLPPGSMTEATTPHSTWCQVHTCVTAAAAYAHMLISPNSTPLKEILSHLEQSQQSNGLWSGFWWAGFAYTTYYCLRLLHANGRVLPLDKAVTTILGSQSAAGSWDDQQGPNAFETSYAINSLLLCQRLPLDDSLFAGVAWLLERQLSDGSWPAGASLVIPSQESTEHRVVYALDSFRMFTTASVIMCLSKVVGTDLILRL